MMNDSRESRKEILQENYEIIDDMGVSPEYVGELAFNKSHVICTERALRDDVFKTYDRSRLDFETMDTISSALKYRRKTGADFLVFASSRHYGGGVWNGSRAQEEDIFLCTDLCKGKEKVRHLYPLDGCLAMDCHIIRNSNFDKLDSPVEARAFFCPAVNLNSQVRTPDFWTRMCTFCDTTYDYAKGDCLVIGAWGCGVFRNEPKYVAGLFKKVMPLLLDDYKRVVVSMPDKKTLDVFKEILL